MTMQLTPFSGLNSLASERRLRYLLTHTNVCCKTRQGNQHTRIMDHTWYRNQLLKLRWQV